MSDVVLSGENVVIIEAGATTTVIETASEPIIFVTEADPIVHTIESIVTGPQGPPGADGKDGENGGGDGNPGYNFIETIPAANTSVATETTSITIKTMRHLGVGTQIPTVAINGTEVTPTKIVGDENIYYYSFTPTLAVGANSYVITSDNGVALEKTLIITRSAVAPSCALTHSSYLKAGSYSITMTTDYDLISTPTLNCSLGSLSAFTGSGKSWSATLTIVDENGTGLFSDAVMVGTGGTGNTINSGASYTVDTITPVIGTANFSTTLWHYETGAMTCTVTMGEETTGFTGYIDLSHFGLSSSYTLSPSGNNMVASFTPARVNAGPEYGDNIRVSDRCGNPATPKSTTDNQLQVIAYRMPLENVTFPAYSATSNVLSGTFTTDANSHVSWGSGQTNSGSLVFTTDYTVITQDRIKLDVVKWADIIAANALGLLNIDVYED